MSLFSTLIREFQVTEVVDFTPGSGAACIAAIYQNVQYMGIPYNEAHEVWLTDLLHRIFIGLAVESDVGADKELINKTETFLARAVVQAKSLLPNKTQSAIGDSVTGCDDSDIECHNF